LPGTKIWSNRPYKISGGGGGDSCRNVEKLLFGWGSIWERRERREPRVAKGGKKITADLVGERKTMDRPCVELRGKELVPGAETSRDGGRSEDGCRRVRGNQGCQGGSANSMELHFCISDDARRERSEGWFLALRMTTIEGVVENRASRDEGGEHTLKSSDLGGKLRGRRLNWGRAGQGMGNGARLVTRGLGPHGARKEGLPVGEGDDLQALGADRLGKTDGKVGYTNSLQKSCGGKRSWQGRNRRTPLARKVADRRRKCSIDAADRPLEPFLARMKLEKGKR